MLESFAFLYLFIEDLKQVIKYFTSQQVGFFQLFFPVRDIFLVLP